jgi:hypothetical protein
MAILKARRAGRKNAIARLRFPAFAVLPETKAAPGQISGGVVLTGAASRLRTELGGSNRPPYEIYHQMGLTF